MPPVFLSKGDWRILCGAKSKNGKNTEKRMVDAMRKLKSYERKRGEHAIKVRQKWRGRLAGLSASPGFGRGRAFVLQPRMELAAIKKQRARNPEREIERFRGAVERGIDQIHVVKNRMSSLISKEEGAIFDVYRLILEDPAIIEQIETQIRREGYAAEYATRLVFESYLQSISQIDDNYLRERPSDVKDAAQRLLENLSGAPETNINSAVCTDCHNPHTQARLTNKETGKLLEYARLHIPETCAQCHSKIYDTYKNSVHGSALTQQGNPNVPTCIDCHGVHNIQDPRTNTFRNSTPYLCAKCHTNEAVMRQYDISTKVLDTYVADFHGTTVKMFDETTRISPPINRFVPIAMAFMTLLKLMTQKQALH